MAYRNEPSLMGIAILIEELVDDLRNSSNLGSMATLGYSPLAAVQIAHKGRAVEVFRLHHAQPAPRKGEQIPRCIRSCSPTRFRRW